MKKIVFISILSASLLLCGCSQNGDNSEMPVESSYAQIYEDSDGNLVYEDSKYEIVEGSLIERNGDEDEPSAPEGSISFEEAVEILDSCSFEELYLPQSVSDYEKYYFGTVTHNDLLYYSIDPYVEADGKKIFVGTNCLVACDGSKVLMKTWASDYMSVEIGSAENDKSLSELYGDCEATPNDAIASLAKFSESQLGLEHSLSSYTFEVDTKIHDIKGIECYQATPKLNYTNLMSMTAPYYISADGSGRVFIADTENKGSYIEIK